MKRASKGASPSDYILEDTSLVCHIEVDRRRYKLFRRPKTTNGIWTIHFKYNRKRLLRSLGTPHKGEAQKRAAMLVKEVRGGKWRRDHHKPQCVTQLASIGQIFHFYERRAVLLEVSPKSAHKNIDQARAILRLCLQKENAELDPLPSSVFTDHLVREFKQRLMEKYLAKANCGKDDQERARHRAWTTGNSMLAQARSLFSRAMLSSYKDAGIQLPESLQQFIREPGFKRLKPDYNPPPDSIVTETFARINELKESDVNVFKVFWLAVGCGLRKGEISRSQWDWFVEQGNEVWLVSNIIGKGKEEVRIPVIPDAWAQICPLRKNRGPILEGTKTEVDNHAFRRLSKWMKGLGWQTEKKTHELRAYVASKIAEKHGMTVASAFLRHKDVRVTQQRYARYFTLRGLTLSFQSG